MRGRQRDVQSGLQYIAPRCRRTQVDGAAADPEIAPSVAKPPHIERCRCAERSAHRASWAELATPGNTHLRARVSDEQRPGRGRMCRLKECVSTAPIRRDLRLL